MNKYFKLLDDLNKNSNDELAKRYCKYCIEYLNNYNLCLFLMKKKDYVEIIKKMQRHFGILETGICDYRLIELLNLSNIEKI